MRTAYNAIAFHLDEDEAYKLNVGKHYDEWFVTKSGLYGLRPCLQWSHFQTIKIPPTSKMYATQSHYHCKFEYVLGWTSEMLKVLLYGGRGVRFWQKQGVVWGLLIILLVCPAIG